MKRTPINKRSKRSISKLKAEAWRLYSIWKRTEDCLRTTGCKSFGLCITCGKRYHFKLLQAGHFIPGRHNANLFNDRGVHAQCYNCNINLRGNTLNYRRAIIELYGEGADEEIERGAAVTKKFTTDELEELIKSLKEKIRRLNDTERN